MVVALPLAAGRLHSALQWHRKQLLQHPYLTNSATSAFLMALGDRFAQFIERRDDAAAAAAAAAAASAASAAAAAAPRVAGIDPLSRESLTRTAILTVWSGMSSLFWTRYYSWLAHALPGRVLVWTLLTAAVPAPVTNAAFFSFTTAAEHLALHERPLDTLDECGRHIREKLEARFVPTVTKSAMVWIPVNLCNFYYVPLEYRILAGSGVSFVWNAYLSVVQHVPVPGAAAPAQASGAA
jgi:hypothetical protein